MAVMIAHASIDENGKINGGKPGDQTKKEVCIRTWYNKPWQYLIRFNDPSMREKCARAMEMAANNDHVGYNQYRRNTLLSYARKNGYDISKVANDCETDCSALVSLACMYAGIEESRLVTNGNSATTRTLRAMLKATGEVTIYSTADYVSNTSKLLRGDILLKEGSHVVVVISGKTEVVTPSKSVSDSSKYIWDFLMKHINNPCGVAGLMGNLQAESGLKPKNVQNSYEKKLGLDDDTYTVAVDTGAYGNFSTDKVGYGLAQWTSDGRKKALYDSKGQKSIGDLDVQLAFLIKELTTAYKSTLAVLKTSKSVRECSDIVLTKFERPKDQSEAVKVKRCQFSQGFYDKYAK